MLQRIAWMIVLLSALALLVGNLILGAVVARTLFTVLSSEQAGLGFGNILVMWTQFFAWPLVLICAAALAIIFLIRLLRGHSNWFTAVGVLALALVATHWWSAGLVQESVRVRDFIRNEQAIEPTATSAQDQGQLAVLSQHFDYLHRTSTRAGLVETLIALLVVLLAAAALIFAKESQGEDRGKAKGRVDDDTIF